MTLPSALHYFPAPTTQAFCSQCGNPLTRLVPPDDNRERDVCNHCGAVHYRNPLIVVGTVPIWNDQILLCRRAIEPRYDTWTLPAGFMELSETTSQGPCARPMRKPGRISAWATCLRSWTCHASIRCICIFWQRSQANAWTPGPNHSKPGFSTWMKYPGMSCLFAPFLIP